MAPAREPQQCEKRMNSLGTRRATCHIQITVATISLNPKTKPDRGLSAGLTTSRPSAVDTSDFTCQFQNVIPGFINPERDVGALGPETSEVAGLSFSGISRDRSAFDASDLDVKRTILCRIILSEG